MQIGLEQEVQGHLLTVTLIQLVLSLTFLAPSASSFVIALPMLALSLIGFIGAIKEKKDFHWALLLLLLLSCITLYSNSPLLLPSC
ncbi:hypothetical protein GEMRC1_006778 [Eukaryota sp. GEM-RC1]